MINTTYKSSESMIIKLKELKGKTKLKFCKIISNYFDEMNIRNFKFEEDPFSENAQGFSKIYHGVLLLIKNFYRLSLRLRIWIIIIMIYNLLLLRSEMKKKMQIIVMKKMKKIVINMKMLLLLITM